MRPEDFKLNSDYLSFAQKSKHTLTATISGGELEEYGRADGSYQLSIPAQKGAIDHIMIKRDSGEFRLGNTYQEDTSTVTVRVEARRTAASVLTVTYWVKNRNPTPISYPPMIFTIKVNTFLPPNVL